MSLSLGPIHHWLYHKVHLQEEPVTTLAEREDARSGDGDKYETYVNRKLHPLEELIDTDNIHSWLQARIHDAGSRYAAFVAAVLKEDDGARSRIGDEVFAFDASNAAPAEANPAEVYRFYGDNLVDGMSYDRMDRVTKQARDHIAQILDQNLHGNFQIQAGQSPELYCALRLAEMRGMLSGARLELLSPPEVNYVLEGKV